MASRSLPPPPPPPLVLLLLLSAIVAPSLSAAVVDDDADHLPVSYRNFQLWSVTPETQEQHQTLLRIKESYGQFLFLSPQLLSFYISRTRLKTEDRRLKDPWPILALEIRQSEPLPDQRQLWNLQGDPTKLDEWGGGINLWDWIDSDQLATWNSKSILQT